MAFTVQDFDDLIHLLDQRPDWREALRRRVMGEDFESLPELVRELVAAQRQTDQRVDQLVVRMDQLTVRMDQLTVRMDQLTERMDQLTARMDQLVVRMDQLTERMDQLTARVDAFAQNTERRLALLEDDTAKLKGMGLEQKYAARPFSYFKQIVRRARTLTSDEIYDLVETDALTDEEVDEILASDVIVAGRRQKSDEVVYLIAEVSWGIGPDDVDRAVRRATAFAKTGHTAIPVVAGDWITPQALSAIENKTMWYVLGGHAVSMP